jgi:hypothetical protein
MKRLLILSLTTMLLGLGNVWSSETATGKEEEKPLSLIQQASLAREKRLEEEAAKKKKADKARLESMKAGKTTEEDQKAPSTK